MWQDHSNVRFPALQGESGSQVNLVIPWLAPADQAKVFPNDLKFDTPADQEKYVREWAAKRTGFDCNFKARPYPGRLCLTTTRAYACY